MEFVRYAGRKRGGCEWGTCEGDIISLSARLDEHEAMADTIELDTGMVRDETNRGSHAGLLPTRLLRQSLVKGVCL